MIIKTAIVGIAVAIFVIASLRGYSKARLLWGFKPIKFSHFQDFLEEIFPGRENWTVYLRTDGGRDRNSRLEKHISWLNLGNNHITYLSKLSIKSLDSNRWLLCTPFIYTIERGIKFLYIDGNNGLILGTRSYFTALTINRQVKLMFKRTGKDNLEIDYVNKLRQERQLGILIDRFNLKPTSVDERGELFKTKLIVGGNRLTLVRIKDIHLNETYVHLVPPDMSSAKEAVAWMFYETPETFKPMIEV